MYLTCVIYILTVSNASFRFLLCQNTANSGKSGVLGVKTFTVCFHGQSYQVEKEATHFLEIFSQSKPAISLIFFKKNNGLYFLKQFKFTEKLSVVDSYNITPHFQYPVCYICYNWWANINTMSVHRVFFFSSNTKVRLCFNRACTVAQGLRTQEGALLEQNWGVLLV